jgi:hypothetical protein
MLMPESALSGSLTDDNSLRGDRRAFVGRVAAGAAAVATGGIPFAQLKGEIPSGPTSSPGPVAPWSDAWLDRIKGKHRQFFDAVTPNEGFALAFAMNFLDLNNDVYGLKDADLTAVVGLRHFAMPMALTDAIWAKYKVGEFCKVTDPSTQAPAVRNIFIHGEALLFPNSTIDTLVGRNVIFTVCNMALVGLSSHLAAGAGVSAETARQEWMAGLLPGMIVVPVGVLAVNRAQERGCTYCYGG